MGQWDVWKGGVTTLSLYKAIKKLSSEAIMFQGMVYALPLQEVSLKCFVCFSFPWISRWRTEFKLLLLEQFIKTMFIS